MASRRNPRRRRPDQIHHRRSHRELHALGLKIVMLTGDNRRTAAAVAKQLGLDAVEAEIEPAGKSPMSRSCARKVNMLRWPAFLYNALGIPVAAGVLYPFFGLLLSPIIAGAAMSLSSVSVIGNALRLRKVRL
jgi:cation transport ATPase